MIGHGRPYDIWGGKFTRPVTRNYKISLCTTCMGRLGDLMQTLPVNIGDNADYPDVEFVLLDYNSPDGLGDWVARNMMGLIESGKLVYARTTEPQWYHMAHSRNVAFKLASGEIVCNVDADNWTNAGFATYVNRLANECPEKAAFAKGRQLLRGRVGFFKREWLDLLGGYDESLDGYGHDDEDLLNRAVLQGFRLMRFGGRFVRRICTEKDVKNANMREKNLRVTEAMNRAMSARNIENGILTSNAGRNWGVATVMKNFREEVSL